jgi:hypothetical protein
VAVAAIVDQQGRRAEREPADGLGELAAFRQRWYGCLGRRADALFELTDVLLCAPGPVGSLPHLSLEPTFRRGWGSLYGALACGSVDAEATRDLLAAVRPQGWPLVFAIDQTSWPRCDAETSPQRGIYYHPSRHSAGQPVVAGWCYQWACQLGWDHDSWTAPVDAVRIRPATDPVTATVAQVGALLGRLGGTPQVPLLVFDAGYDPVALTVGLADVRAAVLVRIRSDRVFSTDPPERPPGTTGRPCKHGQRFACQEPATWPTPTAARTTTDDQYGQVVVQAWSGLHPKLGRRGRWAAAVVPPVVRGTVIWVQVSRLPKPSGPVKVLWLWWAGPGRPDLDVVWRAYVRRFDVEHTLRFCKQVLGWVTPRVRHPEQADRWTWTIIAASTQLRLARHAVGDLRLPWERRLGPGRLTPTRVRRGFRRLHATLPVVASAPKPCGWGPGRPRGSCRGPARRYPAVKKNGELVLPTKQAG